MGLFNNTRQAGLLKTPGNIDPAKDINKHNPNAVDANSKKAFKQMADPNKVNTGITNDQTIVNYKGLADTGDVTSTLGGNYKYTQSGDVTSNGLLKNNVQVSFNGTLGDNLGTIKRLNRQNFFGAHGFRGKGWDTGLDEAGKKAFKEDNPFFMKGRSKYKVYDLENSSNNGKHDNNRTYTYK
jgi:hypothetical protein